MTIERMYFHQLPEDVKEDMPSNGCDKEDASYIHIEWDNGTHEYHSDAMEPEDAKFGRDLSWVGPLIAKAYNEGFSKGRSIERALQEYGKKSAKKRIKELEKALEDMLAYAENVRASGDAGNWEWDEDSEYTKAMKILKKGKKDELENKAEA